MVDSQTQIAVTQDLEWSGGLNQAAGTGQKFALLLAMLQQDVLGRPTIAETSSAPIETAEPSSVYPAANLKAEGEDYRYADQLSGLMQGNITDALLYQIMHPSPLSLHNDPKYLPEEVLANCDVHTQSRLKDTPTSRIDVDETGLYDILTELNPLEPEV